MPPTFLKVPPSTLILVFSAVTVPPLAVMLDSLLAGSCVVVTPVGAAAAFFEKELVLVMEVASETVRAMVADLVSSPRFPPALIAPVESM